MLKIDHLTKHYKETVAINDLDFEVMPGVVTGFLGPNGSGKSTTCLLYTSSSATREARTMPAADRHFAWEFDRLPSGL